VLSTLGKIFVECPKKVLGKEPFADKIFVEYTLDKDFAECKITFAECLRHSAKNMIPVVIVDIYFYNKHIWSDNMLRKSI
jgi:hypothetical protein